MIARPVSLPPAWTIRRAECPPSSPSASSPSGSVSKRTPRLISCSTAAGASRVSDLDRARAAEAAPGGERVGRVALGRVVGGERRGEPALRPEARALGERLARDQRRAGARRGRLERDVEPGGAAADHHDLASRWPLRGLRSRAGYRTRHRWRSTSPIPPRTATTRAAIPRTPARLAAIEAALEHGGLARARASRGAGGDPRAAAARAHDAAHVDAIEEFCAAGGGMIDIDTVASAGSFEAALHAAGGAADAAERLLAGEPEPPSAACARRATTPSATGRWASACSTTPPSPPRTRSMPAAPSGCWCSTGTSTTATAPRRSSPARPTCSTRASTSGRSIRAPAPPSTTARGG